LQPFTSQVLINTPVLPVELLKFSGNTEGGKNFFRWQTAAEINTQSFDLQRLSKENTFETLGTIKAENKAATYVFTDEKPLEDINYYRLKTHDFDGKISFSKTISLENGKILRGVKIYPNPVSNILNIENGEGKPFDIVNVLGQKVLTGSSNQAINVSTLTQGTYILKIGNEQIKFIKE
jgi:hypothetical protein